MSAIENTQVWSHSEGNSKHEKCRNITEEIYKRINITFQIKKLETAAQSDLSDQSDQIDSNELSNETDLFACDKSSISSSTDMEQERAAEKVEKYININNNEEQKVKKPVVVHKRPKKRFRKRVKKRQPVSKHSDGSSDEALPLSRMLDVDAKDGDAPVMGVPNIVILTKDLKQKPAKKEKDPPEKETEATIDTEKRPVVVLETIEKTPTKDNAHNWDWKNCSVCGIAFRGERGLRRHMAMTHKVY